jgi:hypothetical protein
MTTFRNSWVPSTPKGFAETRGTVVPAYAQGYGLAGSTVRGRLGTVVPRTL